MHRAKGPTLFWQTHLGERCQQNHKCSIIEFTAELLSGSFLKRSDAEWQCIWHHSGTQPASGKMDELTAMPRWKVVGRTNKSIELKQESSMCDTWRGKLWKICCPVPAWQIDSVCRKTSWFLGARPSWTSQVFEDIMSNRQFHKARIINMDVLKYVYNRSSNYHNCNSTDLCTRILAKLHLCNLHRSFTSFICSRSSLMRLLSITWLVSISISSFWLVDATLVDAKVLLNWKGRWCAVWSQMNSLTSSNDSHFFRTAVYILLCTFQCSEESLRQCQTFHVSTCSTLNPLWALLLAVAVVADFATWFTWQSAKIEESKTRQPKASDHSNSTAMCQALVSFIKPHSCKRHAWKTAIRSASRVSMMYGTWDK